MSESAVILNSLFQPRYSIPVLFNGASTASHYLQLAGTTESTRRWRISISCTKKSNKLAFQETKEGFVDYDRGQHEVSTKISGLRKDDIAARYRLRVSGNRFQMDCTVSEVVDLVLSLDVSDDDVDGLLKRWIGRFARKNFPFLIKVLRISDSRDARVFSVLVLICSALCCFRFFDYVGVDAARVH